MNTKLYPEELVKEANNFKASILKFVDKINAQEDASSEFYDAYKETNSFLQDKWLKQHAILIDKQLISLKRQIETAIEQSYQISV